MTEFPVEKRVLCAAMSGKRNVLNWTEGKDNVDFYDMKGVVEGLLSKLQQCDAGFFTGAQSLLVPQADLYLADMTRTKQQHAQTGLTDAAADGQRQLPRQQHPVEWESAPIVAAAGGELAIQRRLVHSNAHGGDLEAPLQHRVPQQDVAVEPPVVVVRRTAVVGLAGALQVSADLHEKYRVVLPADGILPLLGVRSGNRSSSSWVEMKYTSRSMQVCRLGKAMSSASLVSQTAPIMARTVWRR